MQLIVRIRINVNVHDTIYTSYAWMSRVISCLLQLVLRDYAKINLHVAHETTN